jgi:hypothetical protein
MSGPTPAAPTGAIVYPESDGKQMADNTPSPPELSPERKPHP